MRLRNKKTGIIGELHFDPDKEYHFTVATEDPADVKIYKKLADLYADWEDYEEPKGFWIINILGIVEHAHGLPENEVEMMKQIGNYFETEEEAKKAVECLRAWKRLKDKGFKVDLWDYDGGNYQERIKTGRMLFRVKDYEKNDKDLDLLFSVGDTDVTKTGGGE